MDLKPLYKPVILDHPRITLLCVILLTLFFAAFIPQFRLDASSDSLLLEGDESLKYYRMVKERYGSDDFLIITYAPKDDLFADKTLYDLQHLRDKLKEVDRVASVTSILDVPLVNSPPITVKELKDNIRTLTNPKTNRKLAQKELTTSPLYSNLIISEDASTTAILLTLEKNIKWKELLKERTKLREKERAQGLSEEEEEELVGVEEKFIAEKELVQERQRKNVATIRDIMQEHENEAELHLGGVPMITVDSINFVRRDLQTFGIAVLCFIVLLLTLFFRTVRWVLLPMLNCFVVGVIMFGFLGFAGWPVTVVSSNFISLLLIFTLSFSVHQIVRYREYHAAHPDADQQEITRESTLNIITPCFFMVVTTIVAFGSLVVSGIRPVIDFGWMMTVGLAVSFIVSFTLFPSALLMMKPAKRVKERDFTGHITAFFANAIENHGKLILITFTAVILFSGIGIFFLTVENRFIDYYKESTEIYQGMETIDKKLGGTTPLDVIVDAPQDFMKSYKQERAEFIMKKTEEDPDYTYTPVMLNGYWITFPREEMFAIHRYLEALPEIGRVLSFNTTLEMAGLVSAEAYNTIALALFEDDLPPSVQDMLFHSYISENGNQIRFNARVFESDTSLQRESLLENIRHHIVDRLGISEDRVHLTGMLVLYNNVLQSLFDSQIKTIWTVFITIFVMFSILFRSVYIAAVAFLPNITITVLVLGIMGWLHIPLDIMTITIAAICTGSADDNTIHYVHRFREEYKKSGDYWKAVHASHDSIGRALYYTSVTIMLGFSILAFSNFVPTIYFGLLTAFAMLMALLANLVLLPLLLVMFKPISK